jgi:hypothetical protein
MKLHRDLREFIGLLKSHEVEYLVIGGWAFGYHATPRYTGDFDFFVRCTPENARRLRTVLNAFGFEGLTEFENNFLQGDRIIQFGVPPNRIDILTRIAGVEFEDAWKDRVEGELDGMLLPFISRQKLIQNKLAAGRSKDLADVEALERTFPRKQ